MAAPKGNQYALGNTGGRPRTADLPEDCTNLGMDFVQWALQPDSLLLCEFYSLRYIKRKEWKTLIQREEFLPYYNYGRALLAKKAINGTMEKSFGQRYIRLYDRDLAEEEDETARYNAELKRQSEQANLDTATLQAVTQVLQHIKQTQIAFKEASSSNKIDCIS